VWTVLVRAFWKHRVHACGWVWEEEDQGNVGCLCACFFSMAVRGLRCKNGAAALVPRMCVSPIVDRP
jgi:hypothetical protein